jgi:hypothetical protein
LPIEGKPHNGGGGVNCPYGLKLDTHEIMLMDEKLSLRMKLTTRMESTHIDEFKRMIKFSKFIHILNMNENLSYGSNVPRG